MEIVEDGTDSGDGGGKGRDGSKDGEEVPAVRASAKSVEGSPQLKQSKGCNGGIQIQA